jgi:hypothetical protein
VDVFRDNRSKMLHSEIMFHWGRLSEVEPGFWVQRVPIVRWLHLDRHLDEFPLASDSLWLRTGGIDHRMLGMGVSVLSRALVSVRFDGTEGVSKAISEVKISHTSTS